jgi:ABC-type oligopeptide transport system ATPase subunit
MTAPLLSVRGLSVTYHRSHRAAVDNVDLEIGPGQTVGLVGESGSGKSSLGSALLGLVPVTAGTVHFEGEDITAAPAAARRRLSERMQVIFQDPYGSMNPARTVGDTIGEGLRYARKLPRAVVRPRVADVLREVGLPESAADRYPARFSGGQRQRIAIARAIVGNPDFIVCDEPVSALDLSVQAQVLNLLARLKASRGLSYLFISHDLSVVRYLSDRIAVMHDGRIVEQGPAVDVLTAPQHSYTRALLAAAPVPDPQTQARNRAARQREERT